MEEEDDVVARERRSTREAQRFFSNPAKSERELWVTSQFLTALQLAFQESELSADPPNSDADVLFRDARFQIKEITEPNLRRDAELKADRARAEAAVRPEDLIAPPAEARDIVLSNVYTLILDLALAASYAPTVKKSLDLLCYVTRSYAGLGAEADERLLAGAGYRSISCLFGSRALVLARAPDAPSFLSAGS